MLFTSPQLLAICLYGWLLLRKEVCMFFLTRAKHIYTYVLASVLFCLSLNSVAEQWPQDITTSKGLVTIYQPQPETLQGNLITGRAAVSFVAANQDLVFGVFWFNANIDKNSNQDQATLNNMTITKARWPDSTASTERAFSVALNNALQHTQFVTSMSELNAGLESAQVAEKNLATLNNEAPEIVFFEQPTILLNIDGDPEFSPIDNSRYERLLNTNMAVIRDIQANLIYLTNGDIWYQALHVTGPYVAINNAPDDLARLFSSLPSDENQSHLSGIPKVFIATEPTELVATDGPANWKSLPGGELIYASNTETPWLRELASNDMYVLLSGRWFRAKQQNGPWAFVRSDQLPNSFANIPPESDLSGLRVSIAGTTEAEEAMLDAQVPETVAINRKNVQFRVTYDGQPQFQRIPNTAVSYATNTDAQVIMVGGLYYAVDNAVWFKAANPLGPWLVADKIPKYEIAKIPPSSPVYNITYVDIYESTPEIVYVGYYPGYMQSFIHYGVPVYGTGWHYRPYRGHHLYYSRPMTWGLNAGYNVWSGWRFGLTWSQPFFAVGRHWNAGYRSPRHYHYPENRYRGHRVNSVKINIRNDVNFGRQQVRPSRHNRVDDLYRRHDNKVRNASTNQVTRSLRANREEHRQSRIDHVVREDKRLTRFDNDKLQQRYHQEKNAELRKQLQNKAQSKEQISNNSIRDNTQRDNALHNDIKQNKQYWKQSRTERSHEQSDDVKQNRMATKGDLSKRDDAKQNRDKVRKNSAQQDSSRQDKGQQPALDTTVNSNAQSSRVNEVKGSDNALQSNLQQNNTTDNNANKSRAEQERIKKREARQERKNKEREDRSSNVSDARVKGGNHSSGSTEQAGTQQRSSRAKSENNDRQQRKSNKQSEEVLLEIPSSNN
jgi:hypothetical protein